MQARAAALEEQLRGLAHRQNTLDEAATRIDAERQQLANAQQTLLEAEARVEVRGRALQDLQSQAEAQLRAGLRSAEDVKTGALRDLAEAQQARVQAELALHAERDFLWMLIRR